MSTLLPAVAPSAYAQVSLKPVANAGTPEAAVGQIFLKVPDTYSDNQVQALADSAGCFILRPVPYSPHYYVFQTKASRAAKKGIGRAAGDVGIEIGPVSSDVQTAVDALQKVSGVLAGPNYILRALGRKVAPPVATTRPLTILPNDPLYGISTVSPTGQAWDMTMIHMPQAWTVQSNKAGRPIIAAVLDSGIDFNHPDLKNQIQAGGKDFTPTLFNPLAPVTDAPNFGDGDGHGTHVSGTVAAQTGNGIGVTGVAGWNRNSVSVKILPIKVLTDQGFGSADITAAGINYAVQQNADVINMSLGGPGYTAALQSAIQAAKAAGVTLVAAAGNSSEDNNLFPLYPAVFPEVINVTSVGPSQVLASYSNFGGNVAITAPGGDANINLTTFTITDPTGLIISTWPTTAAHAGAVDAGYPESPVPGYAGIEGTSQATPHVTGAVALLLAAGAARNPDTIKNILQTTAQKLDETPNFNGNNKYGAGLLDVYAALKSLNSLPPFTAQLAEVADSSSPISTSVANAGTNFSLAANAPYAFRSTSYQRTQNAVALRFVPGSPGLTTTQQQTVTVDIQSALYPNATVRHYVGGVDFDLSTPAGAAANTVLETTVPATGSLNLPDGHYRVVLSYDNGDGTGVVPRGYLYFDVASQTQPQGRALFSTPFLLDALPPAQAANPEQYLFGSAIFTLSRYNPLRLPTDLDYAKYSNDPANSRSDAQARFAIPSPADGLPISTLQSAPTTSLAPLGIGYWLDLDRAVTLTPTGSTVNLPVSVRLFATNGGWNLIGDPFTFGVNWSSVTVLANNRSYSLADAGTAGIISTALVGYSNGQYVYSVAPQGTIDPFNGYWVRVYQDCTLVIPSTPATTSSTSRASHLPNVNGWRARLSAFVAGDKDGENYFGVVNGAADRLDIPKPPAGAGHAYVRFVKTTGEGKSDWYAADLRSTSVTRPQVWNAAVSTDKTNADVTLTWDGLGTIPRDTDLTLTDVSTGAKVALRSRSSYTFRSGEAGSTRMFQITLQPHASAGPLDITNLNITGSSSGRSALGSGVSVRFATTQEAEVTGVVRTLSGKAVATFGQGTRAVAATNTTLHWNGRSDQGASLAAGAYVIEVTARTSDGQVATRKQVYTSLR